MADWWFQIGLEEVVSENAPSIPVVGIRYANVCMGLWMCSRRLCSVARVGGLSYRVLSVQFFVNLVFGFSYTYIYIYIHIYIYI